MPLDGIAFHPYYTVKDIVGVVVFLFVFCGIIFFFPEMGGFFLEHANFEPANGLKTPEHIAPVWYFGAFYSILRAITFDIGPIDSKLGGVIAMGGAIAILFVSALAGSQSGQVMALQGHDQQNQYCGFLPLSFILLTWLGTQPATETYTLIAQICTLIYFAFFLLMPFYTRWEKSKPVPERVTG